MKKLKHLPLIFQKIDSYPAKHAHHLFTIRIDNNITNKKRNDLVKFLKKNNIGTGINYRSVTDMLYYRKNLGWNRNTCKISKLVGDNIVSLPMQSTLTKRKLGYICNKVCEFFQI